MGHHSINQHTKSTNQNMSTSPLQGGDTAGLSLLYTVTGQLMKLKKLARLLSVKGEASQEYRSPFGSFNLLEKKLNYAGAS